MFIFVKPIDVFVISIENRKTILEWMRKKEIRDYIDVGRIVSDYAKYPEKLLKKAKEEMKK